MPLLFPNVEQILDVSIFARYTRPGWQALVMDVTVMASRGAWLLVPLPTATQGDTPDEPSARTIELGHYRNMLDDLDSAYEMSRGADHESKALELLEMLGKGREGKATVEIAHGREDLESLPRASRPPAVFWEEFPEYQDYSFAVVHLERSGLINRATRFAGIGVEFKSRDPNAGYVPMRQHQHGRLPETVVTAHSIFFQTARPLQGWQSSIKPAREFVDPQRAAPVIDLDAPIHWLPIVGEVNNVDLWIRESDLWGDANPD